MMSTRCVTTGSSDAPILMPAYSSETSASWNLKEIVWRVWSIALLSAPVAPPMSLYIWISGTPPWWMSAM